MWEAGPLMFVLVHIGTPCVALYTEFTIIDNIRNIGTSFPTDLDSPEGGERVLGRYSHTVW